MSEETEDPAAADTGYFKRFNVPLPQLLSSSDDTAGSSLSLSLCENSVRLRAKPKMAEKGAEKAELNGVDADEKKWWLKRPDTRLGRNGTTKKTAVPSEPRDVQTTDVTSSMKEFLEKEELCKAQQKPPVDHSRNKDDTLCDILASTAFDKYPSDFENATDEDIGSFLEEMSKIAGALSPSSTQERMKSGDNTSKNPNEEEEKSVEELLEEAEKLVRENVGLSKSSSRTDTLMLAEANDEGDTSRSLRLERDIFQLIEQEVQKESEKIRKSPKNQKNRRETSPGCEIVHENENSLKPPSTLVGLESRKKRLDDDKVEISSSSDLDDPIDRHSRSEDPRTAEESRKDKENLQKEITDVDKDFFDDLLKRSKEKLEGGISGSSSFGQEDFSHFLRILQGQERKEQEMKDRRVAGVERTSHSSQNEDIEHKSGVNIVYPEREITEILEKEFPKETKDERIRNKNADEKDAHEFGESDSSAASADFNSRSIRKKTYSQRRDRSVNLDSMPSLGKQLPQNSGSVDPKTSTAIQQKTCDKSKAESSQSATTSKSELYNVGLTPRLELFADAIPKLIAEKTSENVVKDVSDVRSEDKEKIKSKPADQTVDKGKDEKLSSKETTARSKANEETIRDATRFNSEDSNVTVITKSPERAQKVPDKRPNVENTRLGSSRSYDQLSRPPQNLRSSLDDVRSVRSTEHSRRICNQPTKSLVVSRYSKQQGKQNTPSKPPSKISLKPSTTKFDPIPKPAGNAMKPENLGKYHMAGGDSRRNLTKSDLEALYREEKHKNALLKEQIDSEAKMYKQQIQSMRTSFEEELFAVKKQNIILKAKVDELTLNEKRSDIGSRVTSNKSDTRVQLLEKELEKQEGIINAYETENKRLVAEMDRLHEEVKNSKTKQRSKIEASETQKLTDTIKDLREDALKLNIEVTDLRQKNNESTLKVDDLMQQNSLLKEELEMFKEQLRTKDDFINARLQAMTAAELETRKKADDLRVDLSSKSEQLKNIKIEYEKLERAVVPLEKEVHELRVKESSLMEKLQTAKSHVEREKQLTLKLKDQVILDNKKILDLNRQVREMERILKRKNPDSVSALILTAKSDHERIHLEKVKLLEDRVASLEGEIKAKEEISQEKLCELQKKFGEMKEKYASQVIDLEEQLLAMTRQKTVFNDAFTQTIAKSVDNKSVDAAKRDERERSSSTQFDKDDRKDSRSVKSGPKSQNPKEDTHLIATIRGLKMEIANKDKHFAKINKEFQELQKTNRRLQKERERLLNDRRNAKPQSGENERNGRSSSLCSDQRLQAARSTETNDLNSNHCQNGHLSNGNTQRLSGSVPKLYDPLQYSENDETTNVKKLTNENGILKEELNKINKDFMMLKNKRLHDLNLLQEEHEREMASLVKEYSLKFGDSKVVKLQGQINTQVAVITHLKQQIEKLRDYKEQVLVLKVEREHLENKVKMLNEKVKYLSTPGTEQLQLLQDKITILQQRHESREMTLQSLVRDLLRNKTQCKDCKGEKGKSNKQLCYFRQELDHILGMLQEISNVQ